MKEKDIWDILKIKAVILYLLNNMTESSRDVYHIVKTAYCAQQLHFVKYASRLYVDDITALPFGPVPSFIYDILKAARGDSVPEAFLSKEVADQFVASIAYENELFYAKERYDDDFLSVSNIECLNEAIAMVSSKGFKDIYDMTHKAEYERAYACSVKVMNDIAIAKEGGANEHVLAYLAESFATDKLFCE